MRRIGYAVGAVIPMLVRDRLNKEAGFMTLLLGLSRRLGLIGNFAE